MTTFELTWQQDNNRVPADQTTTLLQSKSFGWYVKAFLKGDSSLTGSGTISGTGLWTCDYSCDSVTAGSAGDGVDRWGGTGAFDATKIVRASGASAHSWMVLKSPAGLGPFYMLIRFNSANDYQWEFTFSKTAFTGGSTTVSPTATNSWQYASQQVVQPSLVAGTHFFGLLSTTGVFHIKAGRDGGGFLQTALSFFSLTNAKTGDAHNGMTYVDYLGTGVGVWDRSRFAPNLSTVKGRNKDATAAVLLSAVFPACFDASANLVSVMADVGNADATDGLFNDYPLGMYSITPGHKSIRGRVADIFCAPDSAPAGNVEPTTGPPYQSAIFGDFWHPYNASVAPSL